MTLTKGFSDATLPHVVCHVFFSLLPLKMSLSVRRWWLLPTQDAGIQRLAVRSQPSKKFHEPHLEKTLLKKGLVEWAQGVGPEFKPKPHKKKKKKKEKKMFPRSSMVSYSILKNSVS
jgi:hypothetical protein